MARAKRSRWIGLGAAFALTAVLIPLQLASASSHESGTPSNPDAGFTIPQGTITLRMNPVADTIGNSYFRFADPDGAQIWVQRFQEGRGSQRCRYQVTSPSPPKVGVSAGSSAVGFQAKDNGWGLGVLTAGAPTAECAEINLGETMTIDFRPGLSAGQWLDSALLDMELKHSATVLTIRLYDTMSDTPGVPVYTYIRTCTISDCGPDSGGSDNRQIRVPIDDPATGYAETVLFDKMEFTVTQDGGTQASATLEGGSDLGTFPSTFNVVTPATPVECEEVISPDVPAGATDAEIVFLTDPETGCPTGKGYVLDVEGRRIELILGGATTPVTTVVTSIWEPELADTPVPATTVSPACDTPGSGCALDSEEEEVWCEGEYDPADAPSAANPGGTYGASMAPGHAWCRITQFTRIVDPVSDLMQTTELSLLVSDASRAR